MDRKGQLLTLDLLLALVPLTLVLGYSASAMTGLTNQMQSYATGYSSQRVAIDAADLLLKSPGEPVNWDNTTAGVLGFASYEDDFVYGHILNFTKLGYFKNASDYLAVQNALRNVSQGRNILVNVSASDSDYDMMIMGFTDGSGNWNVTNSRSTIKAELMGADDVFMVERVTRILTELGGGGPTGNITFDWNYTGNSVVQSSPAIGDINCDGINEIVIASNNPPGGTYALWPNGTEIWFYPSGLAFTGSPALVDLDGDCELEVLIGETKTPGENSAPPANITAIDADGSLMWYYTMDSGSWNAPVVGDIDQDGSGVEVVLTDMHSSDTGQGGGIYVLYGNNGTLRYRYSSCDIGSGVACTDTRHRFKGGVTLADLDQNTANGLEIIGATDIGYVFAIHGGDQTLYWKNNSDLDTPPTKPGVHTHSKPAAADMDGDGWMEVPYADKNGVHIINGQTGDYVCRNVGTYSIDKSALAVADLDASGDGNLEMVVGDTDGYIRAFYNNCTLFWEHDTAVEYGSTYDVQSSPAIADVDNDCKLEVVIGSGGECKYDVDPSKNECPPDVPVPPPDPSYLYIIDAEDGTVSGLGTTRGSLVSSPAIGDLNADGDMEIVIGSDSGDVFAFDVDGVGDGWPSFHQSEGRMTDTKIYREGYWTGDICGESGGGQGGAYNIFEQRARATASIKIYVW